MVRGQRRRRWRRCTAYSDRRGLGPRRRRPRSASGPASRRRTAAAAAWRRARWSRSVWRWRSRSASACCSAAGGCRSRRRATSSWSTGALDASVVQAHDARRLLAGANGSGSLLIAFAAAGQAQARSPALFQTPCLVQLCAATCRAKATMCSNHVQLCRAWTCETFLV